MNSFSGLSPLIAGEIAARTANRDNGDASAEASALWNAFDSVMGPVRENIYTPVTGLNAKGKMIFSAVRLQSIQDAEKTYDTMSKCMEDYYGDKAERDTVKQKVSDLLRFLQNERSKTSKTRQSEQGSARSR